MASTLEELMHSENRLARGSGAEYATTLAEQAVVVVPGAVLDKEQCVQAMDASPGWDEVTLDDARLAEAGDTATVVYHFRGRRGESTYGAVLASTYVRSDGGWRLLVHQQTPDA